MIFCEGITSVNFDCDFFVIKNTIFSKAYIEIIAHEIEKRESLMLAFHFELMSSAKVFDTYEGLNVNEIRDISLKRMLN